MTGMLAALDALSHMRPRRVSIYLAAIFRQAFPQDPAVPVWNFALASVLGDRVPNVFDQGNPFLYRKLLDLRRVCFSHGSSVWLEWGCRKVVAGLSTLKAWGAGVVPQGTTLLRFRL
jgi:hypothetical protein